MEVDPLDRARDLVKHDVVKPFETGAHDLSHPVVGHEEGFFPAHEDVFALEMVLVVEVGAFGLLGEGLPGAEAGPVVHVCFVGCAPARVAGLEGVFWADDFGVEVGC